jgi:aminoglycoside 3-N-acetyltransferase
VLTPTGREWREWDDVEVDEGDFVRLGAELDEAVGVVIGLVGSGESRLMRQRAAVDFAVDWMRMHRPASSSATSTPG